MRRFGGAAPECRALGAQLPSSQGADGLAAVVPQSAEGTERAAHQDADRLRGSRPPGKTNCFKTGVVVNVGIIVYIGIVV